MSFPPTSDIKQQPMQSTSAETDNASDPTSYVRDPHKLVGYLVPFPAPANLSHGTPPPPPRFFLYTPPPPPLMKVTEGQKEGLAHKVQRKWQEEVRTAKTSDAKVASWKGIKGRVTKGISWAVNKTTTADLDFVTRIQPETEVDDSSEGETTKRTVKLEEMVLVYPSDLGLSPDQLRDDFVQNIMRTKSKAEKDAVIATGLLPVALAVDWALVFCGWMFGGALEVDGVWAASSIRGAKTARSVTKRLASSTKSGDIHSSNNSDTLKLTFLPSSRADVLQLYLQDQCNARNPTTFPAPRKKCVEENVLEAIGWTPSGQYEEHNWEDESWERTQVIEDVHVTMGKAAKTWEEWVKLYQKNPKKASKK